MFPTARGGRRVEFDNDYAVGFAEWNARGELLEHRLEVRTPESTVTRQNRELLEGLDPDDVREHERKRGGCCDPPRESP